jgi:uncharacterized protein YjaZ
MAEGKSVSSVWLKGEHSKEPPLQNAIPLFELECNLVLRYSKIQIKDSLYFLEMRGYLIKHGFQGLTRVAFRLSESALVVLKSRAFTNEEQKAFREALFDMKQPGLWGMKFNVGEAWRRIKKWCSASRSSGK